MKYSVRVKVLIPHYLKVIFHISVSPFQSLNTRNLNQSEQPVQLWFWFRSERFMEVLCVAGRLRGRRRGADVLHRLQVPVPLPGRASAGRAAGGPPSGAAVPPPDAAGLPLALLHWHVQAHLPLPQLPLPGESASSSLLQCYNTSITGAMEAEITTK